MSMREVLGCGAKSMPELLEAGGQPVAWLGVAAGVRFCTVGRAKMGNGRSGRNPYIYSTFTVLWV